MKYTSLFTYVIYGTIFLVIRLIMSSFKNSKNQYNKFFIKGIKIISNQNFLFFVILTFLLAFYTFGLLDFVRINWEYLITSLAIFGVSWVIFCIIVLSFLILIVKKWDELESSVKNSSFGKYNFIILDYLKNNVDYKGDNSKIYELYEYLILKYFFCIPQNQVFKESNLRKEINFAYYLKVCLIQNFRMFTKISWTCWILLIFCMYIWSVFLSSQPIFTIVKYF